MPQFVIYPHAALNKRAEPRPVDGRMVQAGVALLAAAQEVKAYGLAAAHLGLDEPVAVVSFSIDANQRDYRLLYNPQVLALADETSVGPEGSVSMPAIEAPVKRAVWADLAYDDVEGKRRSERVEGFVARVAQHEIDQVNGLFFLRRLSPVKRDIAIRKFHKATS